MRTQIRPNLKQIFQSTALIAGMFVLCLRPAAADGLKTVNNPDGGTVVYGPLEGHPSLPAAMGEILRNVHGHFGDRPQIGRFFRANGSDSVATFFTLNAKTEDGRPLAGMVIVSAPAGGEVAAAVLYDNASRFAKTANGMMTKLNAAWKAETPASKFPAASSQPTRKHEDGAPPAKALPLQTVQFPDGTGTIGLPSGWKITNAGAGAVHASGSDGAGVDLGVLFQNIYDPRNPKTAGMVRYMNMAHQSVFLCPYGGSLFEAYVSLAQQNHRRLGTPTPTFRLIDSKPTQPTPYESAAVLALAEMDEHNGKGLLLVNWRLGALRAQPGGQWAMAISGAHVPKQSASEDWPTVAAIVQSYRQNGAALMAQSNAIVDQIHRTAALNQERMDQFHATNDARNAAIDQTRDDQSRGNKSFENYQLDRSVIRETSTNAHGTFDYRSADWLVKNDPNHFEYVQTRDFLKGIDY